MSQPITADDRNDLFSERVMDTLRSELGSANIADLLDELPAEIVRKRRFILNAWECRRYAQIRLHAHGLRGVAATLGAHKLEALCRDIESLAATENADALGGALNRFDRLVLAHIADCFGRSSTERARSL